MSHSPTCVFCWPHQLELPAAFLLRVLASCVLRAGACQLPPPSTGALVLAFGPTCVNLGLAHRNDLKKTAAKEAMPFAFYGGCGMEGRPPAPGARHSRPSTYPRHHLEGPGWGCLFFPLPAVGEEGRQNWCEVRRLCFCV
jgi:hypothetical protein